MTDIPKLLPPQLDEDERLKQERMRDVFILLEALAEREEVTVKMILDCLYDIGSVNLINKKFPQRTLNQTFRAIARLSKPAFRIVAFYWFKKNVPQLLTKWLYSKVRF